jgi:hypothetical protein
MEYKITEKVLSLVTDLIKAGYEGEATITNCYCTGTAAFLGDAFSVQLTGFCKESLHIVEDVSCGEILFVGRYDLEARHMEPKIEDVIEMAWGMYRGYKTYSSYSMPSEFKELFIEYGYLKEKKITKTVWEEKE